MCSVLTREKRSKVPQIVRWAKGAQLSQKAWFQHGSLHHCGWMVGACDVMYGAVVLQNVSASIAVSSVVGCWLMHDMTCSVSLRGAAAYLTGP